MTHTRIRDKDSDGGWPNAASSFGLPLTSVPVQYNPASTWKELAQTQIWSNTVQRLISSVVFWIQMCLLLSHNAPQTFTFHGHFPFWSCEKRGHVFFAIWHNKPSAWMHSWDQLAHLNHILNFLCVRVCVRVRACMCVCVCVWVKRLLPWTPLCVWNASSRKITCWPADIWQPSKGQLVLAAKTETFYLSWTTTKETLIPTMLANHLHFRMMHKLSKPIQRFHNAIQAYLN